MSIYLDKLAFVQVVINCRYSVVLIWTSWHAYRSLSPTDIPLHKCAPVKIRLPTILDAPCLDDVMSYNSHTTNILRLKVGLFFKIVKVFNFN